MRSAEAAQSTFGAGVRYSRRARDLTQRQLGETIGRSQQWVWKVEGGLLSPSIDDALALAEALRIPLARLLPERHRG